MDRSMLREVMLEVEEEQRQAAKSHMKASTSPWSEAASASDATRLCPGEQSSTSTSEKKEESIEAMSASEKEKQRNDYNSERKKENEQRHKQEMAELTIEGMLDDGWAGIYNSDIKIASLRETDFNDFMRLKVDLLNRINAYQEEERKFAAEMEKKHKISLLKQIQERLRGREPHL